MYLTIKAQDYLSIIIISFVKIISNIMENNIISDNNREGYENREAEEDDNLSWKPFEGFSAIDFFVGCAQGHAINGGDDCRIIKDKRR